PQSLFPQQATMPEAVNAHRCTPPMAVAVTPLTPATSLGYVACPENEPPQHQTLPPATTHVSEPPPASTAVALIPRMTAAVSVEESNAPSLGIIGDHAPPSSWTSIDVTRTSSAPVPVMVTGVPTGAIIGDAETLRITGAALTGVAVAVPMSGP